MNEPVHEHGQYTLEDSSRILGFSGAPGQCKVKQYDFKRPDKFSKEQIRTIAIIHETFARLDGAALSNVLRMEVHTHVAAVDQLTFEEFLRSIPNPTLMGIIHMDPLKGSALLQIDPDPVGAMIDRLFGGAGRVYGDTRDLTETERRVMTGIYDRLLANLGEAWSTVLPLRPQFGQIETNAQFAQIVPPTEMVVLVSLEVAVGEYSGMINLCLPYLTIEPIISRLSARYFYSSIRRGRLDKPVTPPGYAAELPVASRLCLQAGTMSLARIGSLSTGDLILLEGWDEGEAFLCAGGRSPTPENRFMGTEARPDERPLLRLSRASSSRGPVTLSVVDDGTTGAEAVLYAGGREKDRELADRLTEPVSELAKDLREGIARIAKRLDDISNRQDEMSDHVFMTDEEPGSSRSVRSISGGVQSRPFDFVSSSDSENLGLLLKSEHPQLAALVLSYVDPAVASQILSSFPDEFQVEVTGRIYTMDRTAPAVLRQVEQVFENRLAQMGFAEDVKTGGLNSVVEILNVAPRAVEKAIIEAFEERDPEMADDIKRHMFVFEDITLLDPKAVVATLTRADREDIIMSLKAVSTDVREYVLGVLDPRERGEIEATFEEMGSVRLSDVEAAQQRIVFVIKTLEDEGQIVVTRQGEDDLVD